MKTANVPATHTTLDTSGCSSCGGVEDRVKRIQEVAKMLAMGHQNLALLYKTLANDYPKESKEFLKAAEKHTKLQKGTLSIVVPDFAGEK